MKIHLVTSSVKKGKYTHRTLQVMAKANGVQEVDETDADIVLVSIDGPDDMNLLKRARKVAGGRPLIAGGFEAFGGDWILSLADAVNVGEGFEFFEELGRAKDVDGLYSLPYVLTKGKPIVWPSYQMRTGCLPLVRITEKSWLYLAGRGCAGKCAFCETGFGYLPWHNLNDNLTRAASIVDAKGRASQLNLITNDTGEVGEDNTAFHLRAQSMKLMDYVRDPGKYAGIKTLRFGVEGWTEDERMFYNKPVPDGAILEAISIAERQRQDIQFFFIVGLPDTLNHMMAWAERVPTSTSLFPKISVKLTRLDPSPHTPLWTYDVRKIERISNDQGREFYATLKARNLRFTVFTVRANARVTWRSALRRCRPEEVSILGKEPDAGRDEEQFLYEMERSGLGHLLTYDGRPMPSSQIVTPWRDVRDKMAEQRGMMPVNYIADVGHDEVKEWRKAIQEGHKK